MDEDGKSARHGLNVSAAGFKLARCLLVVAILGLAFTVTDDEAWKTVWAIATVFVGIPIVLLSVRDWIATFFPAKGPRFGFSLMVHVCAVFAGVIGYVLGQLTESSGVLSARWLVLILPGLVYVTPLLLWLHSLPFQILGVLLSMIRWRK